ncbi:MAG: hypothetical protein ACD_73C00787G0003 [uncultured bacterium]|nr:MAG: hypothetical protein ACD_73C00787G0003 [uncultured bacterium]
MTNIFFSISENDIPFLDQKLFGQTLLQHQILWAHKVQKASLITFLVSPVNIKIIEKKIENSSLKGIITIQSTKPGDSACLPITQLTISESNTVSVKSENDLKQFHLLFKKHLLDSCEGLIAFGINKRISIPLSVYLAKWHIAPNFISLIALFMSLLGGYLLLTHQHFVWAYMLFQINSILDGCDGEVAKMNLTYSDMGKKIDVFSDYLTTGIMFTAGGYALSGETRVLWLISLIFLSLTPAMWLIYKLVSNNKISPENIEGIFHQKMMGAKTGPQKAHKYWLYLTNRDFNIFFMALLAFLSAWQQILWYMLFVSISLFIYSIETLLLIRACPKSDGNHLTGS